MKPSIVLSICESYEETQTLIQHLMEQWTDSDWFTGVRKETPPVVYHVWQTAREADIAQYLINLGTTGNAQQIWHRDRLASRWGFKPERLGFEETGIGMLDEDVLALQWPSTDAIAAYARQTFLEVRSALYASTQADLETICESPLATIFGGASSLEAIMLRASASANRHLGIIAWRTASRPTHRELDLRDPQFNGHATYEGNSLN
jgi:hypothetical protein